MTGAKTPSRTVPDPCGDGVLHAPGSSSPLDIERGECACGAPVEPCALCGDDRCMTCDPMPQKAVSERG